MRICGLVGDEALLKSSRRREPGQATPVRLVIYSALQYLYCILLEPYSALCCGAKETIPPPRSPVSGPLQRDFLAIGGRILYCTNVWTLLQYNIRLFLHYTGGFGRDLSLTALC